MQMKKCFKPSAYTNFGSITLLILRIVMGIAFMIHGFGKIQNPFGWMPPESPVPGIFQALAAISEFGGGLALVLGLLVPLACLGLIVTMTVAVSMHALVMKDPFVATSGGSSYELALVYLSVALVFLAMGPGKFSLDAKIFGLRENSPSK